MVKIEAALSYFTGVGEIYAEQQDLFLKKVNTDFEVIFRMLERKKIEIQYKIKNAY